jgi:hypothetical protein
MCAALQCPEHPTSDWIVQQLREALPLPCPYRYVLFDRDAKVGGDVFEFLQASAMKPLRTSVRGSPLGDVFLSRFENAAATAGISFQQTAGNLAVLRNVRARETRLDC